MASSGSPHNNALTSLFVGNLDARVYRELLTEIFSLAGNVTQCHIVYDKATGVSSGFGFVQYEDHDTAETAMEKFRGRSIYGKLLTIDWARTSTRDASGKSDDPVGQFCLFVGNLSPDVTDEQLVTAFSEFGSCTSAKCAKDPVTYKTQGFAFVSFRERADAVTAMEAMNGQMLNNRPLRVDWAKGKTGGGKMDDNPSESGKKDQLTYEAILNQTSIKNVTAYISGLAVNTGEDKIREAFQGFGAIREIRIPDSAKSQGAETMYAFVLYMDHTSAAKAIFESQSGTQVDGKTVQVHWGREVMRRPAAAPIQRPPVHPGAYFHGGFQQQPQFAYGFNPQMQAAQMQAAQMQAPHMQAPHMQAPHVQAPQMHASQVQAPMNAPLSQPHGQSRIPRPIYHNQAYGRAPPPGPMHQSHNNQHRFRPY